MALASQIPVMLRYAMLFVDGIWIKFIGYEQVQEVVNKMAFVCRYFLPFLKIQKTSINIQQQ